MSVITVIQDDSGKVVAVVKTNVGGARGALQEVAAAYRIASSAIHYGGAADAQDSATTLLLLGKIADSPSLTPQQKKDAAALVGSAGLTDRLDLITTAPGQTFAVRNGSKVVGDVSGKSSYVTVTYYIDP